MSEGFKETVTVELDYGYGKKWFLALRKYGLVPKEYGLRKIAHGSPGLIITDEPGMTGWVVPPDTEPDEAQALLEEGLEDSLAETMEQERRIQESRRRQRRLRKTQAERDRIEQIYRLYIGTPEDGPLTYRQIGAIVGVSFARVPQLMKEWLDGRLIPLVERKRRWIVQVIEDENLTNRKRAEERFGLSWSAILAYLTPEQSERFVTEQYEAVKHYSDNELVAILREAAEKVSTVTRNSPVVPVLPSTTYDDYARGRSLPDGRRWPTRQTMMLRFNTWSEALMRAGLPVGRMVGPRSDRYTLADALSAVLLTWEILGKRPTALAHDELTAGTPVPGAATVRKRASDGRWTTLIDLASEERAAKIGSVGNNSKEE